MAINRYATNLSPFLAKKEIAIWAIENYLSLIISRTSTIFNKYVMNNA